MKAQLMEFWEDEEGATAIEYALIAGFIALAIVAALTVIKGDLEGIFEKIANALTAANT